jgi:glyoxylase-like metal-dependent hydrolase (beta-lactamase superfamily II)
MMAMKMTACRLLVMLLTIAITSASAIAQQAPDVTLTRLDCGLIRANDASSFSDTHGYDGKKLDLPVSCYLVRHGDEYLLWDAGLSATGVGAVMSDTAPITSTVARTLIDQIKQLGIDPAKVTRVAVSHYHLDHVGQANEFPKATLIIGAADWSLVEGGAPPPPADLPALAPWLKQGGKVQTVAHDLDIFGDGSVIMFDTRGHSPGHKSLLVRLPKTGPVLLTGDLFHTRRNYETGDVADNSASRADMLASIDRFKRSAQTLKAKVIIGHEAADIAQLPAFPKAAD